MFTRTFLRASLALALVGGFACPLLVACEEDPFASSLDGKRALTRTDAGPAGDGGADGGSCQVKVFGSAKVEVDVIVAVDSFFSKMAPVLPRVQESFNDFASSLADRDIDAQFILLAAKKGTRKLCVPPPLAQDNCADNPPMFRHIDQAVDGNSALKTLLRTVDDANVQKNWSQHLRSNATKMLVVILSDGRFDEKSAKFDTELLKKADGAFGTTEKRNYVFQAVCGIQEGASPPSSDKCSLASASGVVYQELAVLTQGAVASVCTEDFSSVFGALSKGSSRVGCELPYPKTEAPDPSLVQVRFTPGSGESRFLDRVADASKCSSVAVGWYFDSPSQPSKVMLCSGACSTVNAVPGSKVELTSACAPTVPTAR